jgi:hypothetical protein
MERTIVITDQDIQEARDVLIDLDYTETLTAQLLDILSKEMASYYAQKRVVNATRFPTTEEIDYLDDQFTEMLKCLENHPSMTPQIMHYLFPWLPTPTPPPTEPSVATLYYQ